jgi:hypothetical protein
MSARRKVAVALLLMMPALTSCRLSRKPKPVPLPAKIPVQTQPAPAPPPQQLEPPPQIPPNTEAEGPIGLPQQEPEPLPPPPPVKKTPPRPAPRVPPAAETPPPPAPAPQLVPMLTPAQRQDLERSVGDRINRAQNILASIAGRRLSREQQDMAGQIRTFLRQAEEARGTDLLRANNLAERAEVLAQDLAKRLR